MCWDRGADFQDLIKDHRARAAQILGTDMPAKLAHIRSLIAKESDSSSPLWTGHVETGDYVFPRMLQPDHISRLLGQSHSPDGAVRLDEADLMTGEKIVLPSEITRADQGLALEQGVDTDDDENLTGVAKLSMGKANGHATEQAMPVEKGVRVGPHWFEVVPRNKVQTDLAMLTIK
jgi:hypothetical protein